MEECINALKYLQKIVNTDANPKLFHLANNLYKDLGRGAITVLYTQPSEAYNATGLAPAQFLPAECIMMEDGDEACIACQKYDPETQFVIIISIGQKNDPEKKCIQNVLIVNYIGEAMEERNKKNTISIYELENRLKNKKSFKCDNCMQRRKIVNFVRDPIIQKLVYCNKKCYMEGMKNGGKKLVNWYLDNRHAFNLEEGSNEIKKEDIKIGLNK